MFCICFLRIQLLFHVVLLRFLFGSGHTPTPTHTVAPAPPNLHTHSYRHPNLNLLNAHLFHTHAPTLLTTLHRFLNTNRIVNSPKGSCSDRALRCRMPHRRHCSRCRPSSSCRSDSLCRRREGGWQGVRRVSRGDHQRGGGRHGRGRHVLRYARALIGALSPVLDPHPPSPWSARPPAVPRRSSAMDVALRSRRWRWSAHQNGAVVFCTAV